MILLTSAAMPFNNGFRKLGLLGKMLNKHGKKIREFFPKRNKIIKNGKNRLW
jgi:hypothetical protein